MKKYKLLKWYPSLPDYWKDKDIIVHKTRNDNYETYSYSFVIGTCEVEDNSEFWEKFIEKEPLFTTKDGVEMFYGDICHAVYPSFIINSFHLHSGKLRNDLVLFSTKEAAEKWVHENKPVFSRKQIVEVITDYLQTPFFNNARPDFNGIFRKLGL